MCGISVLINKNGDSVDSQLIKSMTTIISHRGPDAEGFYSQNNIALGHRRLSIIDLDPKSNQPISWSRFISTYL